MFKNVLTVSTFLSIWFWFYKQYICIFIFKRWFLFVKTRNTIRITHSICKINVYDACKDVRNAQMLIRERNLSVFFKDKKSNENWGIANQADLTRQEIAVLENKQNYMNTKTKLDKLVIQIFENRFWVYFFILTGRFPKLTGHYFRFWVYFFILTFYLRMFFKIMLTDPLLTLTNY